MIEIAILKILKRENMINELEYIEAVNILREEESKEKTA